MKDFVDSWMPFRIRNPEPNRIGILHRIREQLLDPLASLTETAAASGEAIDHHLVASLITTLKTANELVLLTEEFATIRTLEDAMESWRKQLAPFQQQGGDARLRTFGRIPSLHVDQLRHIHLVVRESIANSVRHAAASRIDLIVAPWEGGCAVTLADNGRGISPSADRGLGLASMARRMQRAGGKMAHHQKDGTVMEFMIPSAPPHFWEWLRESGRIGKGVSGDSHEQSVRIWDARQAKTGDLQQWFQEWPAHSEPDTTPSPPELAAWLDQQTTAKGIRHSAESGKRGQLHYWTCQWDDDIDPLHWLELGETIARKTPLLIQGSGPHKEVSFFFADDVAHLPEPDPNNSFLERIQFAWAQGLEGPREELSSHLHDHLAQELVAEAMHWELAREQSDDTGKRETYDRFCHEFRQLALNARSLSHEIAAS